MFWTTPRYGVARGVLVVACIATLAIGLAGYRSDDDVRRLQVLSPALLLDQQHLQRLIGANDAQHILISAPDDETALQRQEALVPVLDGLVAAGILSGYQMPAAFIPSLARQGADRALVQNQLLEPLLAQHLAQLGLATTSPRGDPAAKLTIETAVASGAVPLLFGFHRGARHSHRGPEGPEEARARCGSRFQLNGEGVRFVDPTADFSRLLGTYRSRAISDDGDFGGWSISILAGLALRACEAPSGPSFHPSSSALLVPAVLSLGRRTLHLLSRDGARARRGHRRRLHDLCVETPPGHHSVTMLAILLATFTTLLSFGLLGASSARSPCSAFGFTMLSASSRPTSWRRWLRAR